MKESIVNVLDMYKSGQLSVSDAEKLIDALWEQPDRGEAQKGWKDDGKLRVVAYIGKELIKATNPDVRTITLKLEGEAKDVECWGNIECTDIEGNANANGSIAVKGDVGKNATGGGSVSIGGDVAGSASSGGSLSVGGDVAGAVNSGGGMSVSGDISGSVMSGGDVRVGGDVGGGVKCNNLTCENVNGDVEAYGEVKCSYVSGAAKSKNRNFAEDAKKKTWGVTDFGASLVMDIKNAFSGFNLNDNIDIDIDIDGDFTKPVDDGKLRIFAYKGLTPVGSAEGSEINVTVTGDALDVICTGDITVCGEVGGDVISRNGDISCKSVGGDVSANGNARCEEVGGDVKAGNSLQCGEIGGDASAGDSLSCDGDIGGDASAGKDIECDGDINGDVRCGGNIECMNIEGDVNCEGDIIYKKAE